LLLLLLFDCLAFLNYKFWMGFTFPFYPNIIIFCFVTFHSLAVPVLIWYLLLDSLNEYFCLEIIGVNLDGTGNKAYSEFN